MKPVRFTAVALREVEEAAAFYEGRKEGLGLEFYERVDEAVSNIRQNPEGYQKLQRGLRRCNLRRFKDWGLWFRVNPDSSLLVACLSGRRLPSVASERVDAFPDPS